MEFSRQEYWSGLPLATPGILPDLGFKSASLEPSASVGRFFIPLKLPFKRPQPLSVSGRESAFGHKSVCRPFPCLYPSCLPPKEKQTFVSPTGPLKNWLFFFNFLFYIGVRLTNNVMLVSGVYQSDSVIHIHVPILFSNSFLKLLQNIEQNSLLYSRSLLGIHFKYSTVYMLIP